MPRSFSNTVAAVGLSALAAFSGHAQAATVTLTPSLDNTLYQDSKGALSNALGPNIFAGQTNFAGARRAVLKFDVTSIPAGSTITSATLTLTLTQGNTEADPQFLHRVLASWGEGTSDTGDDTLNPGGSGDFSTTNDATWIHRFYSGTTWTTPGGDFDPNFSAGTVVGDVDGPQNFSGAGLVADVQAWLNAPPQTTAGSSRASKAALVTPSATPAATTQHPPSAPPSPLPSPRPNALATSTATTSSTPPTSPPSSALSAPPSPQAPAPTSTTTEPSTPPTSSSSSPVSASPAETPEGITRPPASTKRPCCPQQGRFLSCALSPRCLQQKTSPFTSSPKSIPLLKAAPALVAPGSDRCGHQPPISTRSADPISPPRATHVGARTNITAPNERSRTTTTQVQTHPPVTPNHSNTPAPNQEPQSHTLLSSQPQFTEQHPTGARPWKPP
jgi:hypothetical protein